MLWSSMSLDQLNAEKARLGLKSQKIQISIQCANREKRWQWRDELLQCLQEVNAAIAEVRVEIHKRVTARIAENSESDPPVTKRQLVLRVLSIVENLRADIRNSKNPAEKHYKGQVLKQLEAIWGSNATVQAENG